MIGQLRRWWDLHWQTWTCQCGWNRVVCIADDLAHILHLPGMIWLCELHDRRLMRTMGDENDLHTSTIRQWWDDGEAVELAELGTAVAYETWPLWNTTSTATATVGDVKITTRRTP